MRIHIRAGESKVKYRKRRKAIIVAAVCVVLAVFVLLGLQQYGKHLMDRIPELSFQEALEYTTKDNETAIITVGIIKDGQASYTVYGADGQELPAGLHTYEIGSLTKTFTALMISKAVQENKINIDDTIDQYLPLPAGNTYPSIKELITHTSGYKSYYFESPMIVNFLKSRNDFFGITKDMVFEKVSSLNMTVEEYGFSYSNFGYAVLGLILEEVYGQSYTELMNQYIRDDLGLTGTIVSDGSGDLNGYWDWQEDDAYLSAGALTSNIEDMLSYAQMQLEGKAYFGQTHETLAEINASPAEQQKIDVYMDTIAMAWIIDEHNGFFWHNGGTDNYNCYLGFDPDTATAVVVLSNLSPDDRIPGTVLGIKLLQSLNN